MANEKVKYNRWIIVAYLVIFTTFITGCKKESKAMDINDVIKFADKLTTMKLSSKEEAEKQLGVSLKHVDKANEYFSFYEYHKELPSFPDSTDADVRISNDNKGRWFVAIDFKPPTCIDMKAVREKYPNGIPSPPDPNNLSPDAESTYELEVNSGKLFFGFNYKSGCFKGISFDKTEPVE